MTFPTTTTSHFQSIAYTLHSEYHSVLQISPPPFATLVSVQNAGRAYAQDATISLAITSSLPVAVKHDLTVGGEWGPSSRHHRHYR